MSDTIKMNVSETIKASEHMGPPAKPTFSEEQRLAFEDYLKAFNVNATVLKYEPFVVQLTDRALLP